MKSFHTDLSGDYPHDPEYIFSTLTDIKPTRCVVQSTILTYGPEEQSHTRNL